MPKIIKNTEKHKKLRNRVRLFRSGNQILRQESDAVHNLIKMKSKINIFDSQHEKGCENSKKNLRDKLRSWAIAFNITRRAISALLKLLNSFELNLPKDSRALLSTPKTIMIEKRAGGNWWYYGVKHNLIMIFAQLNRDITVQLNFNIDGLPLFNSSHISLWPILANIKGDYN